MFEEVIATFYNKDKLLDLLKSKGFRVVSIPTLDEDEDDGPSKRNHATYITNRDDIDKIRVYHGFLYTISVYFNDGSKVVLYPDNLNSGDDTLLRIYDNDFLSPVFDVTSDEVVYNQDLETWLLNIGITLEQLENISRKERIYGFIEYPGVPDVRYYPPIDGTHGATWSFGGGPLKLDEREIEKVLNSIDDILLRKKIECILYARVFHKRYY